MTQPRCPAAYVVDVEQAVVQSGGTADEQMVGANPDTELCDCTNQMHDSTDKVCKPDAGRKTFSLLSSNLQHIPSILKDHSSNPVTFTSEVHHRCVISRSILPIMHQMLVVLPQHNALWDSYEEDTLGVLNQLCDDGSVRRTPLESYCKHDSVDGECNGSHGALCSLPSSMEVNEVGIWHLLKEDTSTSLGIHGTVTWNSELVKFILLFLDQLVMTKYNINDIRVLWSENPHQ